MQFTIGWYRALLVIQLPRTDPEISISGAHKLENLAHPFYNSLKYYIFSSEKTTYS